MPQPRRKITITSPILIDGVHAEPGEAWDVPLHQAQALVGAKQAEYRSDPGDAPVPDVTALTRMEQAQNADPPPARISAARAPKVQRASDYDKAKDEDAAFSKSTKKGGTSDA